MKQFYIITEDADILAPRWLAVRINYTSIKFVYHQIDGAEKLKGVRICQQSQGQWVNEWEHFAHREDTQYYWLTGEFQQTDTENEKSDRWALANDYIAITPTTVDMTAYELMDELQTWF